jgi:hypothetical protein
MGGVSKALWYMGGKCKLRLHLLLTLLLLIMTFLRAALQSNFRPAIRRQRRRHVHSGLRLDTEETRSAVNRQSSAR